MSVIHNFEIGEEVDVSADTQWMNPPHDFYGIIVDIDYEHDTISVKDQKDDVFEVDVYQVTKA